MWQAQPRERSAHSLEQTQQQRGNSPIEISTIFGCSASGSSNRALKVYARFAYHYVNLTEERPSKELHAAPYAITFSDEDFKRVHHSHNAALIVSMT